MSFLQALRRPPACLRSICLRHASSSAPAATSDAPAAKPSKKLPVTPGAAPIPKSSCPTDTVITGVNYLKGQPAVLSRPDEEYPEWLWTIAKTKVYPDDGPGGKAERVKRRTENRQKIKDNNFMRTQ